MSLTPERFDRAYEGLLDLVTRMNTGSVADDELGNETSVWLRDYCSEVAVMGESAILAFRAELSTAGLEVEYEAPRESLLALQRIEASLTGKGQDPMTSEIREVPTPPPLKANSPTMRSYVMGECEILKSDDAQGLVISIKHPGAELTWSEILRVLSIAPEPRPNLFAYVPGTGKSFGTTGTHTVLLAEDPRKVDLL